MVERNFNWNQESHNSTEIPTCLPTEPTPIQILNTTIVSEDLRDGLHGSEKYPTCREMLPYVEALSELGIDRMTVGIYPGDSRRVDSTIQELLGELDKNFPHITPIVLCLANPNSLKWTLKCKEINPNLQALVFMGSSPVRRLVQNWSMDFILNQMGNTIKEATRDGLTVIGATEHTTQTPPNDLEDIIKTQMDNGATGFCIADTVGIARPVGAYRITDFVKKTLDKNGYSDTPIEWHGHRDLGNDLQNALMSISAGATRVHTVARGVGERAGNTSLEGILLNFKAILKDHDVGMPWKVGNLIQTLKIYEDIVDIQTPNHGPLGVRHSHTSLGIHADALEKTHMLADQARLEGNEELALIYEEMAQTIYSAVDTTQFGGKLESGIGPWSSKRNVSLTLRLFGVDTENITPPLIENLLNTARSIGRELSKKEITAILHNHSSDGF